MLVCAPHNQLVIPEYVLFHAERVYVETFEGTCACLQWTGDGSSETRLSSVHVSDLLLIFNLTDISLMILKIVLQESCHCNWMIKRR